MLVGGNIEVNIQKLDVGKSHMPTITLNYTIKNYTGTFSYNAVAELTNQHYEYAGQNRDNRTGRYYDIYTSTSSIEKTTSQNVSYIIGHPRLQISQEVIVENAADGNKNQEGQRIIYQFSITNIGDAEATNVKLEDYLPAGVYFEELLYKKYGQDFTRGGAEVSIYDKNSDYSMIKQKIEFTLGKLKAGKTAIVRVITKSGYLDKNETEINVKNEASVSAKVTAQVTSNETNTVIKKEEILTEIQKSRLDEAQTRCNYIGEIFVEKETELGVDLWKPETSSYKNQDGVLTPTEVYCIQPGTTLIMHEYNSDTEDKTKDDIEKLVSESGSDPSEHGCARDVDYYGTMSDTYYSCKGKHYTESSKYKDFKECDYDNLYDVGFIASFKPDGGKLESNEDWSEGKQQAIWMSPISDKEYNKEDADGKELGDSISDLAKDYKTFYEQIMDTSDGKEVGMKAKSTIDYNQNPIQIDTDTEEQLHKIGPFKVSYIDGRPLKTDIRTWYSYGGISNMYLKDSKDTKIPIKSIIKNGERYKVEYQEGGKTFFSNYDDAIEKNNTNYIDWYDHYKSYPRPNEEFYLEVSSYDYDGDGKIDNSLPANLELKIEFSYLHCEATICKRDGFVYFVNQDEEDDYHYCHGHSCPGEDCETGDDGKPTCPGTHECDHPTTCCWSCIKEPILGQNWDSQDGVFIVSDNRYFDKQELSIPLNNEVITTTMKIGGFVFEDFLNGKESMGDNKRIEGEDINLANIEVELYDVKTGKLAQLSKLSDENPNATSEEINNPDDYTRRINPTLTDEDGYYEFRGVDIGKRYYIKFNYNGQTYLPVTYMKDCKISQLAIQDNNNIYGASDNWKQASKGTERQSERNNFNGQFASIGSSPLNYASKNNLNLNLPKKDNKFYNETFTTYDLTGISLNSEGKYEYNPDKQLVDTYFDVEKIKSDGTITDNSGNKNAKATSGLISKTIKNYINNKDINGNEISEGSSYNNKTHQYPTDDVMKNYIYSQIVDKASGGNENEKAKVWKKLQFIEDCQIGSYTKSTSAEEIKDFDIYPYSKYFTTYIQSGAKYPNNDDTNSVYPNTVLNANGKKEQIATDADKGKLIYLNVYPGQLFINQGLWRRQQVDIALRKDVYKATLTINGKTETYKYDTRKQLTEQQKIDLINARNKYEANRTEANYQDYVKVRDGISANQSWEVQAKILEYDNYYGEGYNRELYESDYYFPGVKRTGEYGSEEEYINQLEAYVTYKVTIRNQSQSILARIDEIVDYYDSDYEFDESKSWMMYSPGDGVNNIINNEYLTLPDQDFYDIMTHDNYSDENDAAIGKNSGNIMKYKPIKAYESARNVDNEGKIIARTNADYDEEFRQKGYKTLYIDSLKDKKLAAGEEAYLYLTFKVNGKGKNLVIDANKDKPTEVVGLGKQNIVEINGYSTFYRNGTVLPNGDSIKDEITPAGIIDYDSNPGNLRASQVPDNENNPKYEYTFEDDTDRARTLKIFIGTEPDGTPIIRKISGAVWEDKRTSEIEGAVIGDGVRKDNEDTLRIEGIKVELLEVELDANGKASTNRDRDVNLVRNHCITINEEDVYQDTKGVASTIKTIKNKTEYKLAECKTKPDGTYSFDGIVPGDYIVRFTYGGEYNSKYNGQDYKSTSYQVGINQNGRTDVGKITIENGDYKTDKTGYYGYTDIGDYADGDTADENGVRDYKQNASGSYGYDIFKTDNNEKGNVSDAKDLWKYRKAVNNYSSNNYSGVTFDKANILNQNTTRNDNTKMVAETGVIRFEFEYNRQNSNANTVVNGNNLVQRDDSGKVNNNGYKGTPTGEEAYTGNNNDSTNNYNGTYHIENVDLGLEERPKAGLELSKKVTNVKVVLANSSVLFDANEATKDFVFVHKGEYNINSKKEKSGIYADYNNYDDFRTNNIVPQVTRVNEKSGDNVGKGLINITMDTELMHGATIQITYDMKVTNVGEVDYKETKFYYLGEVKDPTNIVTTSADVVIDYVPNNLKFRTNSNKEEWQWKTIEKEDITSSHVKTKIEGLYIVDSEKDEANAENKKKGMTKLKDDYEKYEDEGYVSKEVRDTLKNYNTIIVTTSLGRKQQEILENVIDVGTILGKGTGTNSAVTIDAEQINNNRGSQEDITNISNKTKKGLIPLSGNAENSSEGVTEISTKLVLSQLITEQNTEDDLSYRNIAEIVKISNDVGRRMAYSVQGNQNPTQQPQEIDSSEAEEVLILPPTGIGEIITYIALSIGILAIVITGAIFIKKIVLKP